MRKTFKKITSLMLASCMCIGMLAGCGKEKEEETTVNKADLTPAQYYGVESWDSVEYEVAKEDHYRNYYEVFLYSYADSNGDGVGDIQGLISKLDYIDELGINGIWLMPTMPSTTYHKYDVVDYYGVDAEYGTLEDFQQLLEECHNRNINLIIDFVFNHTSSKHEWFTTAVEYYRSLPAGAEPDYTVCPYANYYNFAKSEDAPSGTYTKISNSEWSYESVFWSEMPDLNLDNEVVKQEIEKAAKYWLDMGVDGFRLDAAKEYTSGNTPKNTEVLNWFENYVVSVKEDAFVVAEVWDGYNIIKDFYESGIESMFDYAYGDSDGYLMQNLKGGEGFTFAKRLESTQDGYLESNENMVNSPFLSNHDTGRIAGFAGGKDGRIKMACALNQIMSGCSFVYYGEEIGMSGSGKDENKRAPMNWSSFVGGVTTAGPSGMEAVVNKFEPLDSQMEDINSIYWYYRKMLHIRSTYEEIAKGKVEAIDLGNDTVCVISKEYNGEKIYILCNFKDEPVTVSLSSSDYDYSKLVESLVINSDDEVKVDGDNITLPGYGVAFLK